jgi:DNA (cytosine-5)-methyltransferase 1
LATHELILDYFAGGGGASEGIERALGRPVDVAINHDPAAIEMHAANHPHTRHMTEDVFRADVRAAVNGRPVGLAWFSPDCKHFSRAKGGKPVSKSIRGLAWVAIKCAAEVAPRVIVLENVREFADWGPLCPMWRCVCGWKGTEGQATLARRGKHKHKCPRCESGEVTRTDQEIPNPDKKGLTFRQFCGRLRALGYVVEWKVLNAADFGAPTHRRRLFLVARNDGLPVCWPDETHGDPKKVGRDLFSSELKPWRTAAECIDWSDLPRSIFERKKPLAEKTLRRIAAGIVRYVLNNPNPFVVDLQRENRARAADEPLATVTTQDNRFNLVTPFVAPLTHDGERRANEMSEPVPTVTGANRGELGLITPVVANLAHGDAKDGRDRGLRAGEATEPLGTVHAGGGSFALIAPVLDRQFGRSAGAAVDEPAPTTTAGGKGKTALVAPVLVPRYGEREGQAPRAGSVENPLPTVVQTDNGASLVAAFVAKHFGGMVGVPADTPLPTTTARGTQNQIAAVNLIHLNHGDKTESGADEPMRTVTAGGNHAALVYSFLTKYFGTAVGAPLDAPVPTATGKDRFGLVTVTIRGETFVIVDIGMRMFRPRELATAQGFGPGYLLTGSVTNQVERIGNSVCPDVACAIVRANCGDMAAKGSAA